MKIQNVGSTPIVQMMAFALSVLTSNACLAKEMPVIKAVCTVQVVQSQGATIFGDTFNVSRTGTKSVTLESEGGEFYFGSRFGQLEGWETKDEAARCTDAFLSHKYKDEELAAAKSICKEIQEKQFTPFDFLSLNYAETDLGIFGRISLFPNTLGSTVSAAGPDIMTDGAEASSITDYVKMEVGTEIGLSVALHKGKLLTDYMGFKNVQRVESERIHGTCKRIQ